MATTIGHTRAEEPPFAAGGRHSHSPPSALCAALVKLFKFFGDDDEDCDRIQQNVRARAPEGPACSSREQQQLLPKWSEADGGVRRQEADASGGDRGSDWSAAQGCPVAAPRPHLQHAGPAHQPSGPLGLGMPVSSSGAGTSYDAVARIGGTSVRTQPSTALQQCSSLGSPGASCSTCSSKPLPLALSSSLGRTSLPDTPVSAAVVAALAALCPPEEGDADLNDAQFCATCLEPYTDDNPKIVTACGHDFHLPCIFQWAERKRTCPMCDSTLTVEGL